MQDAPGFAQKCQSQYVEPEHVFLAALEQPISTTGGLAARILDKLGIQKPVAVTRIMEAFLHQITRAGTLSNALDLFSDVDRLLRCLSSLHAAASVREYLLHPRDT